ncbi:MAG: PucR family transcriptional regulator [Lachnospiraceae bacterium]
MKKPSMIQTESFLLNMQIITDALEDAAIEMRFQKGYDTGRLIDVRLYNEVISMKPEYVYIAHNSSLPAEPPSMYGALISIGPISKAYQLSSWSIIELDTAEDMAAIMNFVQNIFVKTRTWNDRLQYALNHNLGISELCKISVDYFENPLFIHDAQFYILESPLFVTGMTRWERDQRTGMDMVPIDLINDFKVDPEYLGSLDTQGAKMFSENLRGYRILYVNLWNVNGRYEGRLCINELTSSLKPGHFLAAEHLAKIIQIALHRRNMSKGLFSRPFELIITDILNQVTTDKTIISRQIETLSWHLDDEYVCIKISDSNGHMDHMAISSTCNYIETQITGSYAFKYQDSIIMLLNLSVSRSDFGNSLSQLALIIREGLLKAGISNIYHDFSLTHHFYQQAALALQYGEAENSTPWCHHFQTHVLQYMMDKCSSEMPVDLLCPEKLCSLKQMDLDNETEFYHTLVIYLKNERRATQTAKELFIHRSTLFYRLARIAEILQMDLEDPTTRLYVNICLHLLETQNETSVELP